jgi:hypothetical protein
MAIPFLNDVDFQQNELQNAVLQNLASAPANPVAGQMYFNTVENLMYTFDGTQWVTGKTYAAGDGIDITNIYARLNDRRGDENIIIIVDKCL